MGIVGHSLKCQQLWNRWTLRPLLKKVEKQNRFGLYFIFQSMEQGTTFRSTAPKYPTDDPDYRILALQRSRFMHYYFYIRDESLGPIVTSSRDVSSVSGDLLSQRALVHGDGVEATPDRPS